MPFLEQGSVCEDPEMAVKPVFKVDCESKKKKKKKKTIAMAQASNTTIGVGRPRLNGALFSESEAGSCLADDLPVRIRDARWSLRGSGQ